MRNLGRVLCFLSMLCCAGSAAVAETVSQLPKPTGYVDDYAGVLSPDAKAKMEAVCVELHDKAKAQAFVVTVKTLDGATVDSFANDLFQKWGIGNKKTDRGVLLLVATQDRKYRIEVGYGLEGILNDAKVGDMGRAMATYLQAGNFDAGMGSGLSAIVKVIASDSNVTLDSLDAVTGLTTAVTSMPPAANPPCWWCPILFWVVVPCCAIYIVWVLFRKGGAFRKGGVRFWYRGGGGGSGGGGFSGGGGGSSGGGGAGGSF